VVHCPVALTDQTDAEKWRSEVRKELAAAEDSVVIIQVSRLEEGKGHILHLQALSLLRTNSQWVLWFAGGSQKAEEEAYLCRLREIAAELGISNRVRFLGQPSDVPQLLAAADIFCQANQGLEAFGIAFVEALWAGLPVVGTAMGGPLEIIDSSCGVVVEPDNPALLAQALKSLMESLELRRRLGQNGAARAKQLSDPAGQMQRLERLIRQALEGENRP